MNQQLDHDHAELDARLRAALAALAADAPDRAFAPLDAFWAGLAVHIRAENLHLFPALLRAAKKSPPASQALPAATVEEAISRLRADHDFFMSELAAAMKTLRTLLRPDAPPSASAGLAGLRETLEGIRRRLADHNALEETQAYRWVDVLLDSAQQADLADHIRRELENLPARLKPQATSCAPESDAVCEACGRSDAVRMADRWLCPDCISTAGSCCPEFGAWDAWSSDAGVAPRCHPDASSNPAKHRPGLSTLSIHAGTHHDPQTGGACSPVFTSTAFAFPNPANQNIYPRYFNTPNQQVINRKLAALEGGEAAVTFGSGMAAIATLLLAHLQPGDHAVFQNDLYGGTIQLINRELTRLGVHISWGATVADFAAAVRPETKLLYVESPSNPLLRCADLAAVAALGKQHGIVTIVDNTFATPINQNPLALGFDAVVHSATKYLNGHSDVNAGVVVASAEIIRRVTASAVNFGGMLDAQACSLLERGLKTLAVRMQRHNENGLALARFLQAHPAVARVNYPGLPDHPDHALAVRQMRGFGGMLSFELRDPAQVDRFLSRLRLVMPALSLGGVESLVCVPSRTSHRTMTSEERQRAGIRDSLVRLSVGIEDVEDLLEDFTQALAT
jgi:cystathionine beta-lyase